MKTYKPPTKITDMDLSKSVFLAGSIEGGKAIKWQSQLENELKDVEGTILNPRRDDWDESWTQSIDHEEFRTQVEWELYGLANCNIILMYFQPGTKSPISLLELGLFAKSGKMIVCCPQGYMKKGNVDIVCEQYGVPVVETYAELVDNFKEIVTQTI